MLFVLFGFIIVVILFAIYFLALVLYQRSRNKSKRSPVNAKKEMGKAINCAVIGGGLSGLSTTYFLSRLPSNLISHVSLFEACGKFGGSIQTVRNPISNALQDLGAHSARINGAPAQNPLLRLVSSLNLGPEIVWLPPTQRFIFAGGILRPVNPFSIRAEAPFTRSPLGLILRRLIVKGPPRLKPDSDMSVDEFFRTRFDTEFADIMASALMRGICGADSRTLSVSAYLPMLARWDNSGPNMFLGGVKEILGSRLRSKAKTDTCYLDSILPTLDEGAKPPPKISIFSFRQGMQVLPDTLESNLMGRKNITLRRNTPVASVAFKDYQFQVSTGKEARKETFDAVFMCTPSHVCGSLLETSGLISSSSVENLRPSMARYSSIAVVAFEFDEGVKPLKGAFGHLLPISEDPNILGVVYDSSVLSHLDGRIADKSTTRFTVMIKPKSEWLSPKIREAPFDLEPKLKHTLNEMGMEALRKQLGLKVVRPFHSNVGIWIDCIPCYPVGHPQRVRQLRGEVKSNVPRQRLHLVGSALDGVGLGDCVQSAVNAIEAFTHANK